MALYMLLPEGAINTATGQRAHPVHYPSQWGLYQAWLLSGGIPDPYVPPPVPAETLGQAKLRRAHAIKAEGLTRMRTRLPALITFDDVALLRELILSVAPAARQLTAKMQFCADTYAAGAAAIDAVQAATTIAQVDAVTPAWPAL